MVEDMGWGANGTGRQSGGDATDRGANRASPSHDANPKGERPRLGVRRTKTCQCRRSARVINDRDRSPRSRPGLGVLNKGIDQPTFSAAVIPALNKPQRPSWHSVHRTGERPEPCTGSREAAQRHPIGGPRLPTLRLAAKRAVRTAPGGQRCSGEGSGGSKPDSPTAFAPMEVRL
jgi:hypothetical protein